MDEITTKCTGREIHLLSLVVDMMSTISSEPWKLENKMNARTLGIACGLSLFPQLDPGQATRLLEYLIKNRDQLLEADQGNSADSPSSGDPSTPCWGPRVFICLLLVRGAFINGMDECTLILILYGALHGLLYCRMNLKFILRLAGDKKEHAQKCLTLILIKP